MRRIRSLRRQAGGSSIGKKLTIDSYNGGAAASQPAAEYCIEEETNVENQGEDQAFSRIFYLGCNRITGGAGQTGTPLGVCKLGAVTSLTPPPNGQIPGED